MQKQFTQQTTKRFNPTEHPVHMKLYRGLTAVAQPGIHQKALRGQQPWIEVVVGSGEEIDLPSEYDDAVQRLDEYNYIIGGKGQMLENMTKPGAKRRARSEERR